MATTKDILLRYRFFTSLGFSESVDAVFVETILIPGLAKQGRYSAAASGIELPHGTNITGKDIEYLPLDEAAILVLEFLQAHNLVRESEGDALGKLIASQGFTKLANVTQLILRERLEDPNKLLSSRLSENVARYQEHLQASSEVTPTELNSYKQLEIYNRLRQQAEQLALAGLSAEQIAVLVPQGIPELYGDVNQQAILSVVISRLPDLVAKAKLYPGNRELAARAVTNDLRDTIKASYPQLTVTQNYLYAEEDKVLDLVQTSGRLVGETRLERLANRREAAARALPLLIPRYSSLHNQLTSAFSGIGNGNLTPERLSQALITTLTNSTGETFTREELYTRAARRLNLTTGQFSAVAGILNTTGLGDILTHHQHSLVLAAANLRVTRAGRRLLKEGVNPFLTIFENKDLLAQAQYLLPKDMRGQDYSTTAANIEARYQDLQAKGSTDLQLLDDLSKWLDHHHTLESIKDNKHLTRLAGRARAQRRFYELPLSHKWLEIEDRLTGRRFIRQVLEQYDHLAERVFVIPIGKTKVPILRLPSWGLDKWHGAKVKFVSGRLTKLRGSKTSWGRFQFNMFRHYAEGGYTVNGAIYSASREFWGKRIVKPAIKWLSVKYLAYLSKTGGSGVFKYLTLKAAGNKVARAGTRTATRLLLKMGGKALAKGATKAVVALAAAATAIGGVVSAILSVTLVFDLLKLGYDLVKEAIHNVDFRRKIVAVGAVITAIGAGMAFGPIWALLGAIAILSFGTLLVAGTWTLILLATFTLVFQVFQHTVRLDSAPANLLVSLFCDESGQGEGDSTLNAALCIAKVLSGAGLNPLFGSKMVGAIWQAVISALANFSGAIAQLEASAKYIGDSWTSDPHLQCVGLVAAAAGAGFPQTDACNYATNHPAGWSPGPCRPGSLFVDSRSCPGHIGVVANCNSDSATINCVDANWIAAGQVRGPESCSYPKDWISTYLNKN